MADVVRILENWYLNHVGEHQSFLVAYSGGRDSHVLLHALHRLRAQYHFALKAIHIDHGLRPQSAEWAIHCQQVCQQLTIPFHAVALKLTIPPGESLEDYARQKRYNAFESNLQSNEYLLTAHTLDDQAETFLLQLLRGAGPVGLSGIAARKSFAKSIVARPLLTVNRLQIAEYAKQHQLQWIEDDSNQDPRFARNYLRLNILPTLEKAFPGATQCIARSAYQCKQTQQLLDDYIQQDFAQCLSSQGTLSLHQLRHYGEDKQLQILRYWFRQENIVLPSTKKIQTMLQQMLHAKADANPCVSWGPVSLRRYQDSLYLTQIPTTAMQGFETLWDLKAPIALPDGTTWQAILSQGQGISLKKLASQPVRIAYRNGAQKCRVQGKKHSQPLKKILQSYRIPPWQRQTLPLFYCEDELIGVADLFVTHSWQLETSEEAGLIFTKNDS